MSKLRDICGRLVLEMSLSRIIRLTKDGYFAILSASRNIYTSQQNYTRNLKLSQQLNSIGAGPHRLIGHWQECPEGISYDDCPEDQKKDVVEHSFFVPCPKSMTNTQFQTMLLRLLEEYDQDAMIYGTADQVFIVQRNGTSTPIGKLNLGIGQSYSQYVRKLNTPFVFEGLEWPINNLSRMAWKSEGCIIPPISLLE